jgi:hypothetical protein
MDEYITELSRSVPRERTVNGMHLNSRDSAKEEAKDQAKLIRKIESYEKKFK